MTTPGKLLLDASAIEEWAEETQNEIPVTHTVTFKNKTQHRVAEFNVSDEGKHEFVPHLGKPPI